MLRFENDEIGFEVPDGWSDLSTTSYVLPELASNLTLTRSPVHSTATLAECQRDVLAALVATFPEIEIVERAVADDVVRLVVEWTCELGSLRQLVALALADGELWSLTASTPTIFRARSESQIDRANAIVRTVRVEGQYRSVGGERTMRSRKHVVMGTAPSRPRASVARFL